MSATTDRDKERYLIMGLPRSGTSVMHLAVRGHPNVATLRDEIEVESFFGDALSNFTVDEGTPQESSHAYSALFDALTSLETNENTTHLGAKCNARSAFEAQPAADVLQENMKDLRAILPIREDLVAQYESLRKGHKSNIWHAWNPGAERERRPKITLDPWLFRRYAIQCVKSIRGIISHPVAET